MRNRLLAISALLFASLSAHAGTIVFYTGDPTRPTVGVDGWSYGSTGSVVRMSANAYNHASVGTDIYVSEVAGWFEHVYKKPASPKPALGTPGASGTINGTVYWWFEYIPDNPLDIPTGPYYADIQTRAWAQIDQVVSSGVGGGSASAQGDIAGLLTTLNGTASCMPGGSDNEQHYTPGSPWSFQVDVCEISFTFDIVLQKWLAKAQFLNSAVTQFTSLMTLANVTEGEQDMWINRQQKILEVTGAAGTFVFNTPWL